jgi:general stress protein 26
MNTMRFRTGDLRIWLIAGLVAWFGCSVSPRSATTGDAAPPSRSTGHRTAPANLNFATDAVAVLASARALMQADSNAALITVDDQGRPRARTVYTMLQNPDPADRTKGATIWIMTRVSSRKVDQIRENASVTVYFDDDDGVSYVSVMGQAVIHRDPNHPIARALYMAKLPEHEDRAYFWPAFPQDFLMIEVRPMWLEHMGARDHHPDKATWRPQAVVF